MQSREKFSFKWYLWALVPLVVLTGASLWDGHNIYEIYYSSCAECDLSGVTLLEYIKASPMGFVSGSIISATMLVIVGINDLFDFIAALFERQSGD